MAKGDISFIINRAGYKIELYFLTIELINNPFKEYPGRYYFWDGQNIRVPQCITKKEPISCSEETKPYRASSGNPPMESYWYRKKCVYPFDKFILAYVGYFRPLEEIAQLSGRDEVLDISDEDKKEYNEFYNQMQNKYIVFYALLPYRNERVDLLLFLNKNKDKIDEINELISNVNLFSPIFMSVEYNYYNDGNQIWAEEKLVFTLLVAPRKGYTINPPPNEIALSEKLYKDCGSNPKDKISFNFFKYYLGCPDYIECPTLEEIGIDTKWDFIPYTPKYDPERGFYLYKAEFPYYTNLPVPPYLLYHQEEDYTKFKFGKCYLPSPSNPDWWNSVNLEKNSATVSFSFWQQDTKFFCPSRYTIFKKITPQKGDPYFVLTPLPIMLQKIGDITIPKVDLLINDPLLPDKTIKAKRVKGNFPTKFFFNPDDF
jgi:hypothetical protein